MSPRDWIQVFRFGSKWLNMLFHWLFLQIIEQSEPQKRFLSIYGNQSFGVSSHLQLSALAEVYCFTFSIIFYLFYFIPLLVFFEKIPTS